MYNFGSLFTGIGGLDLGFERAGFTPMWQSEIDPYCCRVLKKHWPDVPNLGDIHAVSAPPPVDGLIGGFPCQPVSVAGRQKAKEDSRWLWPEFARTIRLVEPRWVVVENVPGLCSVQGGEVFGEILSFLASYGYDADWDHLSAAAVGAPHLRDRVWIVADAHSAEPGRGSREREGSELSRGQSSQFLSDPCGRSRAAASGGDHGAVADADYPRQQEQTESFAGASPQPTPDVDGGWWATEPNVGRVADGVPKRVDRLRALGNAVVPQCAEVIAHRLRHLLDPF